AAQALDYRREMIDAARRLARRGDLDALAAKVSNAPAAGHPAQAQFLQELALLQRALADSDGFQPSPAVQAAWRRIRHDIPFMAADRAMHQDIHHACTLVESGALLM